MPSFELPGATENPSYRLARDVQAAVHRLIPRSTPGLPPAGQIARRIYSRLDTRFQATAVLLALNQPEEAYTLTRAMMYDSQRLQVLAANETHREAQVLWWHAKAVRDLEGRALAAKKFGSAAVAGRAESIAIRNRQANADVARKIGIKARRLPSEGRELAVSAGHADDELDQAMASDPSHSALVAALWHDREDGRGGVLAGGNDPFWTRHVSGRASRHFLRAAAAIGVICDLRTATELAVYRDQIEARIDKGTLPEPEPLPS